MNPIIRHLIIRAALKRSRRNHIAALDAAREIKAQRRLARRALHAARARRLYAAWLDPHNPGWPDRPAEKLANVIEIAPIQFPMRGLNTTRTSELLGGIHFAKKGGAA